MLMAYCAHDLRARPSERVREDGCIGVEQAGDHADEPDRTSRTATRQDAARTVWPEVGKGAGQPRPADARVEHERSRGPAACADRAGTRDQAHNLAPQKPHPSIASTSRS